MEFSDQFEISVTSARVHLRRAHSLDNKSDKNDSSDNNLEADTDAAQMLNYLDDYEILDDIGFEAVEDETVAEETLVPMILNKYPLGDISVTGDTAKVSIETSTGVTKVNVRDTMKTAQKKSRRLQLIELRKSVKVLTSQLDALTHGHPQELFTSFRGSSKSFCPPMWKSVALRQFQRRRYSEAENVRLKEILETQVQEAKHLQHILKRRAKIQIMEEMLGMTHPKNDCNRVVPADNSQIHMKMLHEMDKSYRSVDNYFNPLSRLGDTKINANAITGVLFETTQSHLLPFNLCDINNCSWAILKNIGTGDFKRAHEYFNKLVDPDVQRYEESHNTIVMRSFSPTPGIDDISGAHIWNAMRVYVEENQTVFIWKIISEPKLEGSNLLAGYRIESTLYVVIRPDDTWTLRGKKTTQLLIHFIGSRLDLEIPISSRFRKRGHNEISIGLWEKLISYKPSEIESEVIDNKYGIQQNLSSSTN